MLGSSREEMKWGRAWEDAVLTRPLHLQSEVAKSCPALATPWTVACPPLLSMGFCRPEYWSGLPFPTPGDLPDTGIELPSLAPLVLAGRFLTTVPHGNPQLHIANFSNQYECITACNDAQMKLKAMPLSLKKNTFIYLSGCTRS